MAILFVLSATSNTLAIGPEVAGLKVSLHNLVTSAEQGDVSAAQDSWREIVNTGGAENLPLILQAMGGVAGRAPRRASKEIGPLTQNWLRAAVDTIAEREVQKTGSLPTELLETFVQDKSQSPRARRVAYEWLAKSDSTAPARLLPMMLDDASLELRYDAIALLLDEAEASADEAAKLEKYQRALRSAREKGQLQACAEALKQLGQAPNMARQLGFLVEWKVIGPFDNTDRKGFNKIHLAVDQIDLDAEYAGKHGQVSWIDAVAEQEQLEDMGKVDFNAALVEEKSVLAYAYTTFVADRELNVECRYESKEATKLWVNGAELAVNPVYHSGGGFDQYIVPCRLKQGQNEIVIKVCQNEQTQSWTKPWDFRLRVTDELGGAIQPAE
ncbi:MAG: hypothetical protein ACR2NM_01000 [Bythopirellula sp.]